MELTLIGILFALVSIFLAIETTSGDRLRALRELTHAVRKLRTDCTCPHNARSSTCPAHKG